MQQTPIIWPKFENVYLNRSKFTEALAFEILKKYTVIEPRALKHMWNGPGRTYHDWQHARFLMSLAAEMKDYIQQDCNFDHVILAILFHDVIYVPGSCNNEEMSADIFSGVLNPDLADADELYRHVRTAIKYTNYGVYGPVNREIHPLIWWLQQLDLYQLIQGEALDLREDLLLNFIKVYHEFENRLLWNGIAKDEDKKTTFEKNQNDFLARVARNFGFTYRPITWAEIQAATYRKDPIDLDEVID
jgi:hypothetical protein